MLRKDSLVKEVERAIEADNKTSQLAVETVLNSIIQAVRSGDKVEIRGFGTFNTRQLKPRIGRNPKTGARVEVRAKKVPFFKPSHDLRNLVNQAPLLGVQFPEPELRQEWESDANRRVIRQRDPPGADAPGFGGLVGLLQDALFLGGGEPATLGFGDYLGVGLGSRRQTGLSGVASCCTPVGLASLALPPFRSRQRRRGRSKSLKLFHADRPSRP